MSGIALGSALPTSTKETQMESYTWELTPSDIEYFDGKFKSYEETFDDEEICEIKDAYINGNTAVFREIVKLIKGDREITKVFCERHDIQYEIQLANNCIVVYNCETEETVEFDNINSVENIRSVINFITEVDEYLPINTITLIE